MISALGLRISAIFRRMLRESLDAVLPYRHDELCRAELLER